MKFPPILLTILQTLAWLTLALGLFIGWSALPYLPSNHPPEAAGLPAGWTPAGPDLALQWADPLPIEGRGHDRFGNRPWHLLDGQLTFLAVRLPRSHKVQLADKLEEIHVREVDGARMLSFAKDAEIQVATEIGGQFWVIAHPRNLSASPFFALRIDPTTGVILEHLSIAPDMADRKGTLWEESFLSFLPVPELGGVVICSSNASLATPSVLWRPGEPVVPFDLHPLISQPRTSRFVRADGQTLIGGEGILYEMDAGSEKLTLTPLGQTVTSVQPLITVPRGWDVSPRRHDPALEEPPMRLRQAFFTREYVPEWRDTIPLSITGPQDVVRLRDAIDSAIRRPIQTGEFQKAQDAIEVPVYVAQPMTLDTPAGTTVLTCDTGAAEVEAQQHHWLGHMSLFRLNSSEALVAQLVPFDDSGKQQPVPILRFGLLTATSQSIQWLCWSRLPALPANQRLLQPSLAIYADGAEWTLGFNAYVAGRHGFQVAATTTTMSCPTGVMVDGTGWLISSR